MEATRPPNQQNQPNQAPREAGHGIVLEEWNEEQLEAALEKLKEVHLKLRSLRSTIPRMVQPLANTPLPPPDVLNAQCQKSLTTGLREVTAFKETIESEELRRVLDHAKASRRKNSKNIKPWRARDDPDWATLTQR